MRYLGIDYGLRYVGLALGDDETRMASPYRTIDQTRDDLFALLKNIISEEDIRQVVVGMPERFGTSTEQEDHTRLFIDRLRATVGVLVHEWTEQFSSKEAQRRLQEGGGGDEHSVAAMLILQSYFDSTLTPNP